MTEVLVILFGLNAFASLVFMFGLRARSADLQRKAIWDRRRQMEYEGGHTTNEFRALNGEALLSEEDGGNFIIPKRPEPSVPRSFK